jgi:hypothetical protein
METNLPGIHIVDVTDVTLTDIFQYQSEFVDVTDVTLILLMVAIALYHIFLNMWILNISGQSRFQLS